MELLSKILIAVVALEHIYIMYFEMFAWETLGKRIFKSLPQNLFTPTKTLAANQGLYNGFLAAGLIWSLFISDKEWSNNIALTASKKIFFTQALPAIITLLVILFLR